MTHDWKGRQNRVLLSVASLLLVYVAGASSAICVLIALFKSEFKTRFVPAAWLAVSVSVMVGAHYIS